MKKDQDKLEKQLAETQAENRRLQDPLQKAREELAELHKQLSSYERDKVSLAVGFSFLTHTYPLPLLLSSFSLPRMPRLGSKCRSQS